MIPCRSGCFFACLCHVLVWLPHLQLTEWDRKLSVCLSDLLLHIYQPPPVLLWPVLLLHLLLSHFLNRWGKQPMCRNGLTFSWDSSSNVIRVHIVFQLTWLGHSSYPAFHSSTDVVGLVSFPWPGVMLHCETWVVLGHSVPCVALYGRIIEVCSYESWSYLRPLPKHHEHIISGCDLPSTVPPCACIYLPLWGTVKLSLCTSGAPQVSV